MQKENIQFLNSNYHHQHKSTTSLRNSLSTTPKHHKFNSTTQHQRHPLSNTYSSNALSQKFKQRSQSPLSNLTPTMQQLSSRKPMMNQSQRVYPQSSSSVSFLSTKPGINNSNTSHLVGSKGQCTSEVAAMKKQLLSLNKQLQTLSKQHQKVNTKHATATSELKKLRQQNETLKEESISNKRLLQKQGNQKIELDDVISKNKEYIRKLERTVTKSASGTALADANLNLSSQNEKLREQNERMKSKIMYLEQKQRGAKDQIQILTRALDIKASQFNLKQEDDSTRSKGNDIRCSLLYDVGQSREEIKKFKEKLNQAQGKIQILQLALEREQTKSDELEMIRESNNKAFIKVEEELLTAKSNLIKAEKSNEEIEQQRVALLQYVEQIQNTQEQQIKSKNQELAFMRKQISALEQANVGTSKSNAQLELQLQDINKKLMDSETVNSSIAKQYDNQKNHISELQKNYQNLRDQKAELVAKCAEIESQLKSSQKREDTLRKQHQNAIDSIEQQRKQYEKIVMKAQDLEYTLRVTAQAQEKSESVMQEKMETTLTELESVAKERNLLKNQVHDAVKACQFSQKEGTQYKIEGQRYKERLDSLINSKNIMQRTLTDQLQSMEQLMSQSKDERRVAKLDNEELSSKIRDTQMKNRQLLEEVRKLRKYHNTMNSMHH